MRSNPILNALCASAYIAGVMLLINYLQRFHNTPDTIFDGIAMLSLLVFSAAVMAFLFFYQPVVLLIENKKKEAVSYFLKMLGVFGFVTVLVFVLISVLH